MSRMSIPQLVKAFNGVPRREEMSHALAYIKPYQNRGHREYDVIVAGEALVDYYHRMANSAMVRYENRKSANSTYSLGIAEKFNSRAAAIEERLKELRET